jgi:hypothetical protein
MFVFGYNNSIRVSQICDKESNYSKIQFIFPWGEMNPDHPAVNPMF